MGKYSQLAHYLYTGKDITPKEAKKKFGFTSVGAVYQAIWRLRRRGHPFFTLSNDRINNGCIGLYNRGDVPQPVAGRGYRRKAFWEDNPYLKYVKRVAKAS